MLGFLLIFKGAIDIVEATMTKEYNHLWGLGLAAGIVQVIFAHGRVPKPPQPVQL